MKSVSLIAGLILALGAPSTAIACSIVFPADYEGSAKQRRNVKSAIEQATAIVDGEVTRPWSRDKPALVRVHHVLKGSASGYIEVGGEGAGADCSIALERVGERSRMILRGGPAIYDLFHDQSEARLEDLILKSDRRKIWPFYPGQSGVGK